MKHLDSAPASRRDGPAVSEVLRSVLIVIRPTNTEYDNLRPFLAYAPARLQERVIALIGSRPIAAGYSWTEEIGENNCRWRGLAVVGHSVLSIDAIAPAYPERSGELHQLIDARVILFPGRHVEWLGSLLAERIPQLMRQANVALGCQWTVSFSDGTSLTFPEDNGLGSQQDERAELLASALVDLLDR